MVFSFYIWHIHPEIHRLKFFSEFWLAPSAKLSPLGQTSNY